jgi:hypothetical protein
MCEKQFNVSSNMRRHYRTHLTGGRHSAAELSEIEGFSAFQKFEPLPYARAQMVDEDGRLNIGDRTYSDQGGDEEGRMGSWSSSMDSEEEEDYERTDRSSVPSSPASNATKQHV